MPTDPQPAAAASDMACAEEIFAPHGWEWMPVAEKQRIAAIIARHAAEQTAELQAINAELLAACKAALDTDPCQLDHHGYCQAHGLGDPCEQKLLRSAIARAEAAEAGREGGGA